MKTWNIGNTTVRNPQRLREALLLFSSKMSGRPYRKPEQFEFQGYMIDAGLVDSDRRGQEGDDGARKFASAFKQLGFITDWSNGKSWRLTEPGKALIEKPNIENTIFLRQLLKYQLPSALEKSRTEGFNLRPFRLFLRFLKKAHDEGMVGLTKDEIGLFVITTLTENDADFNGAFSKISAFRKEYTSILGGTKKRAYAFQQLEKVANQIGLKPNTLLDYADSNSRYCLMSGLLTLKGNKIAVSESRVAFINDLLLDKSPLLANGEYLQSLYDAKLPLLPTDNSVFLSKEVNDLVSRIQNTASTLSEPYKLPDPPTGDDVLELQEYEQALRKELKRLRELIFYRQQNTVECLDEIQELLENIRDNQLVGGQVYAPAYFEWAVWRLFLAINHFESKVEDTRGFEVDEDMQPIHHAKGGAADLKFEYKDFTLVCEMTLMQGSRQFAAEGEPVTRHVFKAIRDSGDKPVYGLFVAKKIDPNTVDTFHNARYWSDWNMAISTPVVSIEIDHLLNIVEKMQTETIQVKTLQYLLERIITLQSNFKSGPDWYRNYEKQLLGFLSSSTALDTGKATYS